MFGLGPTELIVIFLLIIVLFGAKRLPELARSLGRSIKEFKHATEGLKDELDMDRIGERPKPQVPPKSTGETPSESTQPKKSEETN